MWWVTPPVQEVANRSTNKVTTVMSEKAFSLEDPEVHGNLIALFESNEIFLSEFFPKKYGRKPNLVEELENIKNHYVYLQFLTKLTDKEKNRIKDKYANYIAGVIAKSTESFNIEVIKPYAFTYHKSEATVETNEDSYKIDSTTNTFSLSDGATSSPEAGAWSRMIVEENSSCGSDKKEVIKNFPKIKEKWDKYWEQRKNDILNKSHGWWTETILEKPNGATYCSLTFDTDYKNQKEVSWRALAIGDSCVLHFREGKLLKSFPIDDPLCFTDRPNLLKTTNTQEELESEVKGINEISGIAQKGDTFVLATDALAEWILKYVPNSQELKQKILLSTSYNLDFEKFILEERKYNRLKDDDSTLIIVGVR